MHAHGSMAVDRARTRCHHEVVVRPPSLDNIKKARARCSGFFVFGLYTRIGLTFGLAHEFVLRRLGPPRLSAFGGALPLASSRLAASQAATSLANAKWPLLRGMRNTGTGAMPRHIACRMEPVVE